MELPVPEDELFVPVLEDLVFLEEALVDFDHLQTLPTAESYSSPTSSSSTAGTVLKPSQGKGSRGPRPRLFKRGACQATGCTQDLTPLPYYNQRNHICLHHKKAESFVKLGSLVRFCQRCGTSHPLAEFEGAKRSCRKKLDRHNARRRKQSPGASSASLGPLAHAPVASLIPNPATSAASLQHAAAAGIAKRGESADQSSCTQPLPGLLARLGHPPAGTPLAGGFVPLPLGEGKQAPLLLHGLQSRPGVLALSPQHQYPSPGSLASGSTAAATATALVTVPGVAGGSAPLHKATTASPDSPFATRTVPAHQGGPAGVGQGAGAAAGLRHDAPAGAAGGQELDAAWWEQLLEDGGDVAADSELPTGIDLLLEDAEWALHGFEPSADELVQQAERPPSSAGQGAAEGSDLLDLGLEEGKEHVCGGCPCNERVCGGDPCNDRVCGDDACNERVCGGGPCNEHVCEGGPCNQRVCGGGPTYKRLCRNRQRGGCCRCCVTARPLWALASVAPATGSTGAGGSPGAWSRSTQATSGSIVKGAQGSDVAPGGCGRGGKDVGQAVFWKMPGRGVRGVQGVSGSTLAALAVLGAVHMGCLQLACTRAAVMAARVLVLDQEAVPCGGAALCWARANAPRCAVHARNGVL